VLSEAEVRQRRWQILRARAVVLLGFDPSQPRDEQGRWTDTGGGVDIEISTPGGTTLASPSPAEFIEARNKSSRSQFMSPLKPEDLDGHKLLMTTDKKAGVAIDPKGDLQNLFNNGGPKGIGAELVATAIDNGAKTLDCYDGYLPGYYHQFGFVETGRMKFNPAFAHGWDAAKQGSPDVVFMRWNGYLDGGAKGAIERANGAREKRVKNEPSRQYFDDYDLAKEQSRVHG